jgi:hypothetical protein
MKPRYTKSTARLKIGVNFSKYALNDPEVKTGCFNCFRIAVSTSGSLTCSLETMLEIMRNELHVSVSLEGKCSTRLYRDLLKIKMVSWCRWSEVKYLGLTCLGPGRWTLDFQIFQISLQSHSCCNEIQNAFSRNGHANG